MAKKVNFTCKNIILEDQDILDQEETQTQNGNPKPKFNPKKSFTPIVEDKPAFDPSMPFEKKNLGETVSELSTITSKESGSEALSTQNKTWNTLLDYIQSKKNNQQSDSPVSKKPVNKFANYTHDFISEIPNQVKLTTPEGAALIVDSNKPEFQNPQLITQLQERINNKDVTDVDIATLSKGTGKTPQAIGAYVKGDNAKGEAFDTVDVLNKTNQELVNTINHYNTDYGGGQFGKQYNPEEILSSPDKTAEFLQEYEKKTGEKAAETFSKEVFKRKAEAEKMGYNDIDVTYLRKMALDNTQEELGKIRTLFDVRKQMLQKQIIEKTAQEGIDKAEARDVTVQKIAKRINPTEYYNSIKATIPNAYNTPLQNVGVLIDEIKGNSGFKNELLNSVKGDADIELNNTYAKMANDKAALARINGDENMMNEARLLYTKVDKNILDKYPVKQMQQMANEIATDIATEAGQLNGSETEDYGLKIAGFTPEQIADRIEKKGWLNDPKKKALAMQLIDNPSLVKDASYFGGVKSSFLQPFIDLGLSVMDLTGVRSFKDIYSDKLKDELFPKEFNASEIKPDFEIYNGDNPVHQFRVRSTVNGISNLAGLTAGAFLTEGISTELGASVATAKRLSAYATFGIPSIDANLKDSYNFIDNDAERAAYVTLGALINGEGGQLLDLGKISRVPGLKEDFKALSKNLVENNLTTEAKDELLNNAKKKYVDFVAKYGRIGLNTAKETGKGAATMAYFTFANQYNKLLNGDPNTKAADLLPDAGHAFVDGIFTMIPFGFVGGAKMAKNENSTYKDMINKFATMPDAAEDVVRLGAKSEQDFNYKISVINTAKVAKNALDATEKETGVNLTPSQRSVYVANKTIEASLRDKAEKTVNKTTKEKLLHDADKLNEQSMQTLDGLKFTPTLEPLYDLYEAEKTYNKEYQNFHEGNVVDDKALLAAKDNYEKLQYKYFENPNAKVEPEIFTINNEPATKEQVQEILDKGQQEFDKYDIKYTGSDEALHKQLQQFGGTTNEDGNLTHSPKSREILQEENAPELFDKVADKLPPIYNDPTNKNKVIEELTNQGLTNPTGLKSVFKGDEEQALEFVARNTVTEINDSIDSWKDIRDKEGTEPAEKELAREQISLLKKGLKAKGEIHKEDIAQQDEVLNPVSEEKTVDAVVPDVVVDNGIELQEKQKEINGYDKLKAVEKNGGYIKTDETITDKDYEPNDVEYERTKAYKVEYAVKWSDNESSSNPDVETFKTIDQAYNAAQTEGDWWNGGIDHLKRVEPVYKEVWLNKDGTEYEETGNNLNGDEFADTKEGQEFIKGLGFDKWNNSSEVYIKDFGKRDENSRNLESEAYHNLGGDLETTFKADNGETYKIKHTGKGKYSKLIIEDKNGDEIDSVQLRIADHTYNPRNNDDAAREGKFISVEIANVNATKEKFNTSYSLRFDGTDTYKNVLEQVKDKLDEILSNKIEYPKEQPSNKQEVDNPVKLADEKTEAIEVPDTKEISSDTASAVSEVVPETETGKEGGDETKSDEKSIGDDKEGITHAANEVRRQDRALPEYQKEPQTFEAWNNEAEKLIKDGYDVEKLMTEIEAGKDPDPVENAIRKIYIATLDAEIAKNPTDALLAKQKRFIEIGDLANSRAGRNLVSLKGEGSPLSSISDFYVAKMQAAGVDKLTDQQKAETKKAFDDVQKADENAAAAMEAYKSEIAKLKADIELLKEKKSTPKKEKGDWAQQRKDAVQGAKDALKKLRTGESGLSSVPLPGIREFIAIAPYVKKYVGGLLGEGVHNLKEVVTKAYNEFKEILEGITENDIHNIIAGEYNEKKPTRNELSAKMRDLKDEAYYINKLDNLLKGEEPKTEKELIKRNVAITELREKIKDISGFEPELRKAEKERLGNKEKFRKNIDKELGKTEKELDAAEEKQRKEEHKQAASEAKRLQREFEKEQRISEKAAIKAAIKVQLEEARKLEKELSYRSPEEKALDVIINRNKKQEAEIKERISKGDFETKKELPFLEDKEMQRKFPQKYNAALDAIKKKEDARHEFDIALLRDELSKRNFGQKATDFLSKSAGTIKAITTGIDDSAVAIQTYVSLLVRPRTGAKAFYEHIRQAGSQKKFDRWLTALHTSADFKEMKDMGLDVTEPTSLKEREKEEIFNNRFNGTIKIKGKEIKLIDAPLKPFERAFTTLGNVTRVVGYRTISAKYKRQGYTPEKNPKLFKSLATRLNTETGRGNVNEYVDMANKVVTMGVWSPKLMATKFNLLGVSDAASLLLSKAGTKGYYRQLHPKERLAAIIDIAQFAITVAALSYGAALAFGGDVDDDPLSSTFMDVKLDNGKSYNFTGGFSGYIRAISQFAMGKKNKDGKSIKTGRLETAGRFFRGKTPPLTSAILNMASGKNFMGQPTTVTDELINLSPISLKGIVGQIQNDGAEAFLTQGIPTFFGFNVKNEKDYQKESSWTSEDLKNPVLKVFSDKGVTKPNYDPEKIQTQEVNGKVTEHLSDYSPEIQKAYTTKHFEIYKKELNELQSGKDKIYRDTKGTVHINPSDADLEKDKMKRTLFKNLTDVEINYLEGQITAKATKQAKKLVLANKKPIDKKE